ncbi:MAG TPA: N-formylglutamate amidohydrolase [Gammaproteobacteria bacterium]
MEPFVVRPATADRVPLVVSIPHTGTYIPEDVRARLASDHMRALPMTDWHLHPLYDFLPELGVTTIHATWSRFVADLNRPPDGEALYPGRFETGIVARETFWGDVIWNEPPADEEIAQWKTDVHAPYHAKLLDLLDETRQRFGRAVLIDAHSVASRANRLHGELEDDIYLGNRDETTCGPWLIDSVQAAMEEAGLRVVRNFPYKGGYITAHYGSLENVESLQIEMAQRVYMDENDPGAAVGSERFLHAKEMLARVFEKIVASEPFHSG